MNRSVFGRWWVMLLAGIVSLVLGILMIRHPLAAFDTLSTLLVVNFIVIGIIQLLSTIFNRKLIPHWIANLILPALMVLIGIFMVSTPYAKEEFFCVFAGAGILLEGISSLQGAIVMRRLGAVGSTFTLILAILSIIAGIFIISNVFLTIAYMTIIAAVGVILFGVDLISAALLARNLRE